MSFNNLKNNANMEKIQTLNTKNKLLVGGCAAAVILAATLLFGGGDTGILSSSFPTDGSREEQCEYFTEYQNAFYQAAIDGMNADDIKQLMRKDTKSLEEIKNISSTVEKEFYKQKTKIIEGRALSNLTDSLQEDRLTESELAQKLAKSQERALKRCLAL